MAENADPVTAAMVRFHACRDAYNNSTDNEQECRIQLEDADQELIDTPATTRAGAALKLQHALDEGVIRARPNSPDWRMFTQIIEALSH